MKTRMMMTALTLTALTVTAAATEEKLPANLPTLGAPKPLSTPAIDQSRTAEGLTLWVVKRPNTPKTTVMLVVRGGEASDPPAMLGLSDALTSTLNEGTTTRSAQQLSDDVQSVGAEFNSDDTPDSTFASLNGLGEGTFKMIDLIADIAQHATFPEAEVALDMRNLRSMLDSQLARAEYLGQLKFTKLVFGEHPYSVVTASAEVIAKITPAALRQLYQRRFRPEQALLIVAGDVDVARVKKETARAFAGWKGVGASERPLPPLPASTPSGRRIFLVDRPGSVQSHIEVGGIAPRRDDPQFFAMLLADQIYGGGFTSRLMSNIREDKGYSYSPFSSLAEYRLSGLFRVVADVRNEVTAPSLVEILYELDRMWTTPVTDKELERAKRAVAGYFALRNQLGSALAYTLANEWVLGLPADELSRYIRNLNSVTVSQVQQAAARMFPSLAQTILIVGDKPKIASSLARLGTLVDVK